MTENKIYQKLLFSKDIGIIDEEQRIIEGYITDDLVDIDGHVIDANGFKSALDDYLQWGNIRDQHGLPVAKVVGTPEWNKLQVKVIDDAAWNRARGGLYKGFSIGIRVLDLEIDEVSQYPETSFVGLPPIVVTAIKESGFIIRITKMVLAEVSIVDRPANPRALITSIKSANGKDNLLPYVPILGNITKAQDGQGDIKMEEEITQVEQPDNVEIIEENVVENQVVTDNESRIANLEKSVSDLSTGLAELSQTLNGFAEQFKSLTDLVSKQVENESVEMAVVETETEVEDTVEIVDQEKQMSDLLEKMVEKISTTIDTKFDDLVKRIEAENAKSEDMAPINQGEQEQPPSNVTKTTKPTYRDLAVKLAGRFGKE